MKIALVHSFYRSDYPSGENIAVSLQAKALNSAGLEVRTFSRNSDDFMGQTLYPLTAGLTVSTGLGPSPLPGIRKFRPDIVHVHNLFPNWGTSWLRQVDVPIVATVHNFRPMCSAGTLLRNGKFCDLCPTSGSHHAIRHSCYQKSALKTIPLALASRKAQTPLLFNRANALVFLSERTRATYDSYGLGFASKSHVVPNFSETPKALGRLSQPKHRKGWIYAGRLSPEKGILDLIKNWPSEIPLDVVGGGPDEQKCRDAARGKNITLHGQMNRESVLSHLHQAQAMVFPSTSFENSPLIYLEALSFGLPVVALRGNAVSDDIEQFGTGVSMSSLKELSHAIDQINADYDRYSTVARRGYEERYSEAKWLNSMEKIYRDVYEFGRRENR